MVLEKDVRELSGFFLSPFSLNTLEVISSGGGWGWCSPSPAATFPPSSINSSPSLLHFSIDSTAVDPVVARQPPPQEGCQPLHLIRRRIHPDSNLDSDLPNL
uniref:Uncharacterized protein n=1 Tax=Kalanchoe fedtschenkoi TaxID=63787 RepID=A0A7N0V6Q2_KALFE